MKNLLTKSALALVLSVSAAQAQSFDDAGTDYSTVSVDEWVEDQSNQIVDQVNDFACILKAARLDVNANRTYEVLIDEEECFGSDEDSGSSSSSDQSTAERVEYARATVVSQRNDGANEPQNMKLFFSSSEGDRYIAKAEVRAAPSDDLPFGSWSFSYVDGGSDSSPLTSLLNVSEGGFVDIAEWNGTGNDAGDSGFEITTGNLMTESGSTEFEAGKVRYNSTNDVATFFGMTAVDSDQELVAGRASGQYYYRWSVTPDTASTGGTERCMDRDDTWSSVHQYKLFYKDANTGQNIEAGDEVELQGGFGFTYGDNDDFGWFDNWGVWFGGDYPFSSSVETVQVTNDDDETFTLNMTPGRLIKKTFVPEDLAIGDTFRVWAYDTNTSDFIEYTAVYAGAVGDDGTFDMTPVGGGATLSAQTLSDQYALGYLWSAEKMASVEWDGGISIAIRSEEDVTFDSTIVDGEQFIPQDSTNWNTGVPYASDTTFFVNGTDNAVSGLELGVLYESSDTTLDANDTSQASFNGWSQVNMIRQSDVDAPNSCDTDVTSGCAATYTWYSGSQWDFSYQAVDADGVVHSIDEPISFSYTYQADADTNHDRNPHNVDFDYTLVDGFDSPVANICTSGDCAFQPSDLNDKKYQLRYNGEWLEGLPYTFADDGGYPMYIQLINLADGTELTDADGTDYVVKAVALSESIRDVDMTECSSRSLQFAGTGNQSIDAVKSNFASIGFDPDELLPFDIENPSALEVIQSVDDYGGLPATDWKQDFDGATAAPVCTITHGDNTGCEGL